MRVISGEQTQTFKPSIPAHTFEELGSAELLTTRIEMLYMSPLRRAGQVAGAIVISRASIVKSAVSQV